jgi:hypothetical protein
MTRISRPAIVTAPNTADAAPDRLLRRRNDPSASPSSRSCSTGAWNALRIAPASSGNLPARPRSPMRARQTAGWSNITRSCASTTAPSRSRAVAPDSHGHGMHYRHRHCWLWVTVLRRTIWTERPNYGEPWQLTHSNPMRWRLRRFRATRGARIPTARIRHCGPGCQPIAPRSPLPWNLTRHRDFRASRENPKRCPGVRRRTRSVRTFLSAVNRDPAILDQSGSIDVDRGWRQSVTLRGFEALPAETGA